MSALDTAVTYSRHRRGCNLVRGKGVCDCLVSEAISELAQLRAHIAELEAERQWQPIETAPKGTILILIRRGIGMCQIEECENIDGFFYAKWSGNNDFAPTHWMPLPEPPEVE